MLDFRMRKFFARILLPIVTIWLIVMPRQAFAAVPKQAVAWAVPAAVDLTTMAAANDGFFAAATAAGVKQVVDIPYLGLGAYVGYMVLDFLVPNTTQRVERLPLIANNPVPAPTAPASASTSTIYNIGSAPNQTAANNCSGGSMSPAPFSSPDSACAMIACWSENNSNYGGYPKPFTGVVSGAVPLLYCQVKSGSLVVTNVSFSGGTGCAAGYTASGGSCVLTDARAAAPDNACDFSRTGTTVSSIISDPNCFQRDFICTTTSCTAVYTNPTTLQPARVVVTPRADGGSDLIINEQKIVNGQTQVKTSNVTVSAAGIVEAVTGSVSAGSVLSSGAAPVLDTTQNVQQAQTQSSTLQFPSDYARSGEAAAAAAPLGTKLDTLHNDLSTTTGTIDPVEPLAADMPGWGNTFGGLTGWQLPAHSSACPTPSVDLSGVLGAGRIYSFDAHCGLIQNHFNALQAAMTLVWTIMGIMIVLRA